MRRRRPTEGAAVLGQGSRVPVQQQQPQFQQPDQSAATRGTVPRRPVEQQASLAARNRNRSRVRTRVRPQPAAAAVPAEPSEVPRRQTGPPKFALSSQEAIQQFRESNRFVPETSEVRGGSGGGGGGGGRLTVLSTGGRRTRPPPALKFEDDPEEFAAFPAVPNRWVIHTCCGTR